jgi:hypothetical protein
MVNGNAVNYTTMAMVQALSVRLFSCYRHVTLVTSEVNSETRELLRSVGTEVRDAQDVFWAQAPKGVTTGYKWLFAKLNLWRPGIVGSDRAVYIDADTFLLSPAADGLVENACLHEHAELCAGLKYNADVLEAGVLVVRPSTARFGSLMAALEQYRGGPNQFLPDMDFLTSYFNVSALMKAKPKASRAGLIHRAGLEFFNVHNRTAKRRPSSYDACPGSSKYIHEDASFLYSNKTRRKLARYTLWHHCGKYKLDRLPLCAAAIAHDVSTERSSQSHPFCEYRTLRLYQWLQQQANRCTAHGASAAECLRSAESCHWCSDAVRCIPRKRSCQLGDLASRALTARAASHRDYLKAGWCSMDCDPTCCAKSKHPRLARMARLVLAQNFSEE